MRGRLKIIRINNISRKLTFLWTKHIKIWLKLDLNQRGEGKSKKRVELVIPCLDKDLATLPIVVESLRRFLRHPLGNIYIVAPKNSNLLIEFCRKNNCQFINEELVAPFPKKNLVYKPQGLDRSGWVYQQLIKLNADTLVKTPNFLVWDADTLLVRPQAYFRKGKFIINHSDEYHLPYFENYKKLLNQEAKSKISFISHKTIMSKKVLGELKDKIEQESGKNWHTAIIDSLDQNEISSFASDEVYGNFINTYYPRSFILEYWFNNNFLSRKNMTSLNKIQKEAEQYFNSVSWHSYND